MWDVVVIGTGLSGLTAAQILVQRGYTVLVLEKSRGVGGRLATRRVNGTVLDHGCPFLEPLGPYQSGLIDQGLAAGLLQPWNPAVYDLRAKHLYPRPATGSYYTARAGLSVLAKQLAVGLRVEKQAQVKEITALDRGWQIDLINPGLEPLRARLVVMAIPAPQISPLITQMETTLAEIRDLQTQLEQVCFIPILTVMAGYAANLGMAISPSGATPELTHGWVIWGDDQSDLAWMTLDSSKRQDPCEPVVVIHSQASFARSYLEQTDLTPAGHQLLTQGSQVVGAWIANPAWMQVHRWRYGQVSEPLPGLLLKTDKLPSLVGCGDWCGGGGVEAAIASGERAGTWITEVLDSKDALLTE
ncbi:MAG: FAD-dependent oxidoreductase [Nodosilinea sp. LVE1205-7]|jgi:predicted NAD/FAD-dependent oxidoreductase